MIVNGNLAGSASCSGSAAVEGGINAPGGIIESGGSVSARFCENSVIRAYGDVAIAESIMHSVIETERELKLSGDKGRIIGGVVKAGLGVSAFSTGSSMGIPTVIEIGVSPKVRRELARLKKELYEVRTEIAKIKLTGVLKDEDSANLDSMRLKRKCILLEDKEKEFSERAAIIEDSIRKAKPGHFSAEIVLPGTIVLCGLDPIEFTNAAKGIRMGCNETN